MQPLMIELKTRTRNKYPISISPSCNSTFSNYPNNGNPRLLRGWKKKNNNKRVIIDWRAYIYLAFSWYMNLLLLKWMPLRMSEWGVELWSLSGSPTGSIWIFEDKWGQDLSNRDIYPFSRLAVGLFGLSIFSAVRFYVYAWIKPAWLPWQNKRSGNLWHCATGPQGWSVPSSRSLAVLAWSRGPRNRHCRMRVISGCKTRKKGVRSGWIWKLC